MSGIGGVLSMLCVNKRSYSARQKKRAGDPKVSRRAECGEALRSVLLRAQWPSRAQSGHQGQEAQSEEGDAGGLRRTSAVGEHNDCPSLPNELHGARSSCHQRVAERVNNRSS